MGLDVGEVLVLGEETIVGGVEVVHHHALVLAEYAAVGGVEMVQDHTLVQDQVLGHFPLVQLLHHQAPCSKVTSTSLRKRMSTTTFLRIYIL